MPKNWSHSISFYTKQILALALKILEICSCFPPSKGGVERCVYELSTRFAERNHKVVVATSSRGKKAKFHKERIDKLDVIRFPERFHIFEAPILPTLSMTALFADYDVLHVHGMSPTITDLSIFFAKLRGKPVVLTYHNDAESDRWGRIAKVAAFVYSTLASAVIRRADVIVSSTRSYAETSPALKPSLDRLKVIPMGVDAEKYEQLDLTEKDDSEHDLLFVGQLKDYKGVEVLLEAIYYLRLEGHNVKLKVVGTVPESGNLRRQARLLGLEQDVLFLGNVSDTELMELYATCDSLVLPSLNRREAFGIVLLEAIAAGRNVVASDIPGVNEVASLGGGYLARPNDAQSLANSILSSLQNKRHPESIRMVAKELSWDKLAAKYLSIFEELVTKS